MANDGLLCWSCGRPTGIVGRVMRSDACPHCTADLRSCHGCRHYDPTRRLQCRENIEHRISDKTKSNLCDFFQMRHAVKGPGGLKAGVDEKDDRKKKFDDLFND